MGNTMRKVKLVINLEYSYAHVKDALLGNLAQLPVMKKDDLDNFSTDNPDLGHTRGPNDFSDTPLNSDTIKASLRVIISGQNTTDVVIEVQDMANTLRKNPLDISVLRLLALRIYTKFLKDYT